jgi:hypothetical protein
MSRGTSPFGSHRSVGRPTSALAADPHNKGVQNWPERAANLQKRSENIETCMRRAGYRVTAEWSAPLKTYESCMKIADKLMRGPTGSEYRDADWR